MFDVFSRSWEITKTTFRVMMADKELFLFPILSSIFSVLFVISMLFPTIISIFIPDYAGLSMLVQYVLVFFMYFGLSFIAVFFNTCTVYTAMRRFSGEDATFSESIKFSVSRIKLIFYWSLLSATVGILLRALENMFQRFGLIGRIIMGIISKMLGLAWSILTVFVVPSMVYKKLGPIDAINNSVQVLKKTWGESLVRVFGLGAVESALFFSGMIFFIIMGIAGFIYRSNAMIIAAIVLGSLYALVLFMVFSVANTVFNTAIYVYGETGSVPSQFNEEVLKNAFKKEDKKAFG